MNNEPTSFEQINPPAGERTAHGLAKIALALRHRAWSGARAHDLTPTQGEVLASLHRRAPASLSEVARQLAIGRPTASEAVSTLVAKGLVRKETDATDRRRVVLALTDAGHHAARQALLWPHFLAEVVDELEASEQAALVRALQKVIRRLQERGEIPVSRMCATCTYFRPHRHADPRRPHHCAYVDLPFGDRDLRFDCAEHEPATGERLVALGHAFSAGG